CFTSQGMTMPAIVACSACQTKLRVADDMAGRRLKCPKCSQIITAPAAVSAPPPPAKPAAVPPVRQPAPAAVQARPPAPPPAQARPPAPAAARTPPALPPSGARPAVPPAVVKPAAVPRVASVNFKGNNWGPEWIEVNEPYPPDKEIEVNVAA